MMRTKKRNHSLGQVRPARPARPAAARLRRARATAHSRSGRRSERAGPASVPKSGEATPRNLLASRKQRVYERREITGWF